MEPKGVLTSRKCYTSTQFVYEMRDRLVILDPKDTRVSVNIFDKGDGSDEAIPKRLSQARGARTEHRDDRTDRVPSSTRSPIALRAMFYTDQPGSIRLLTTDI